MRFGNDIDVIQSWGYYTMFYDLTEHACQQALQERGILLGFHLDNDLGKRAYSEIKKDSSFLIHISVGYLDKLYDEIVNKSTYNDVIKSIIDKYDIKISIFSLKELVHFLALSACFAHEFGHIINGHLDYKNKHIFRHIDYSKAEHKNIQENMLEYDADSYCGIFMAGFLYITEDICSKENNKKALIDLVCISSYILFYTFLDNKKDSINYPPYIVRMHTVISSFCYAAKMSSIYDIKDGVIIINDDETKELIQQLHNLVVNCYKQSKGITLKDTKEEINTWIDLYKENNKLIAECHEASFPKFPMRQS